MLDDVAQEWVDNIGVQNIPDRELVESRNANTRVSDPSRELHRYVETAAREWNLDTSQVCDLALRVELSAAIDDKRVAVTREDFDITYAIPPAGWVAQQEFRSVNSVDKSEETLERGINFSTRPAVFEMANYVVKNESSNYDTKSGMIKTGCERLLGKRAPRKSGEPVESAEGSNTSEANSQKHSYRHPVPHLLFGSETRREIVRFVIEADPESRYRMGEIVEDLSVGRESVHQYTNNLLEMVELGLLDIATDEPEEANIVFYQRSDTPVVELLAKNNNHEWLRKVFDSGGKRRIVAWFLSDWARNINEPVSRNKIIKSTTMSCSTVYGGHVKALAEADILVNVDNGDQYAPADSERVDVIVRLEDALRTVTN